MSFNHRLPLAAATLLVVALVQPALAESLPIPKCRLDSSLQAPLQAAFQTIRTQWRATSLPAFPFDSLSLNADSSPKGLRLDLVRDADAGQVDANGCLRPGKVEGLLDERTVA